MALPLLLPVVLPMIALICLAGGFYPSRLTRGLLIGTGAGLLIFTVWYVAVFFFGF